MARPGRKIGGEDRRIFAKVLRKLWEMSDYERERQPSWRLIETTLWLIRHEVRPKDRLKGEETKMKKISAICALLLFVFVIPAWAVDFTVRWDPVLGATGYKIYVSNDLGVTWAAGIDVGNVTQKLLTGMAEDRIVFTKASAYNAAGETVAHWMGAWYDFRKKPLTNPGGTGIQ
jgi:hypothetical protein